MTKTFLLAATALGAVALAGAAQAQVITNVTISGVSRAQTGGVAAYVDPAVAATDPFTGGAITAIADTPAGTANTQYLLARESFVSPQNLSTSGTTTTTAQYRAAIAATGGLQYLGPIAGGTYQVTLTLTGGRFQAPVGTTNFDFLNGSGTVNNALVTATSIVAGGAVNDTFVTLQFTAQAAATGRTLAGSIGGVTIAHPFKVDAFNTNVGVSVNTVIVTAAGAQPTLAGVVGTPAQRARAGVVTLVDGYSFSAGGVADAANGAAGFASTSTVDLINLPNYLTVSGDGIASVNFSTRTQTGANTTAFRGLTGQPITNVGYIARVNALNGTFGTTVNSLRPGNVDGNVGTAGNAAVATGGASASFGTTAAPITGGTATNVFINRGSNASAATTALASTDQRYSVTVTPVVPDEQFINADLLPARTFTAQTVQLAGASFIAPWVQSTGGYNTVIRVSNNGSVASGTVQVTLASPLNTPTATSCSFPAIAANSELAINSAALTTCFGNFGRGDVTVRVLSQPDDLTAKLRIVNPGNVVAEQSLGRTIN